MTIQLRIDQVTVKGVPIPPSQYPALKGAIATELSRLINTQGLASTLKHPTHISHLQDQSPPLTTPNHPSQLGTQIAQAAFRRIGP